jgi:hypothetical protein
LGRGKGEGQISNPLEIFKKRNSLTEIYDMNGEEVASGEDKPTPRGARASTRIRALDFSPE